MKSDGIIIENSPCRKEEEEDEFPYFIKMTTTVSELHNELESNTISKCWRKTIKRCQKWILNLDLVTHDPNITKICKVTILS